MPQRRLQPLKAVMPRLALALAMALPLAAASAGPANSETRGPAGPAHALYLPVVAKPPAGLHGRVTHQGAAAPGVVLKLYFYNGSSWSFTGTTTTTDAAGRYFVGGLAALAPGQRFSVCFDNDLDDESRLAQWCTRDLTAYDGSTAVLLGDFDVANVLQTAPAPGAQVGLPHQFQWLARPWAPGDNYEFNLYDDEDFNPYYYTNPALGFTNSYTLPGLPPGFETGTMYFWDIWILGADGSAGISYWRYGVVFTSAGVSVAAVERAGHTGKLGLPAGPGAHNQTAVGGQ